MSILAKHRRIVVPATIALLSLGSLSALASTAAFSDAESPTSNTFSSGTIDLTTTPSSSVISFSTMAPGDSTVAPLTVRNNGSLETRYAVRSSATNTDGKGLGAALVTTIKTGVTCTPAGFGTGGTVLFSGYLSSVVMGDPAAGQQTGDRILAAAASENLCIKAELPLSASNTLQGAATTATIDFTAEQTKNN